MRGKTTWAFAVLAVALLLLPSAVSSDSDAGGAHTLTAVCKNGTIVDASTGQPFVAGEVLGETALLYVPNSGHEFVEWSVEGECRWHADGPTITVSALGGDVTVTAVSRNYSTSQELITVVDSYGTPVPGDVLVNTWMFRSDKLVREGMMWEGMPCTPLIVGDVAYVRAGGILYALNVYSGTIIKSILSGGTPDYYHYISYGNGVIFDTMGHKAYDLGLNYLYDIPVDLKYASFHNGYFYGCLATKDYDYFTMYKTSTDIDKDLTNGVKDNLFENRDRYRVFNQWGQFSNVLFENGYFFFLQADRKTGRSGWRAMTAINLETEVATTVELEGFTGMPWDDGWLSYYNGYFYLTAYTAGLFDGVIGGLEDKRSSLMWVHFDFETGTFGSPRYEQIKTPDNKTFRGIASGLEIHNGRGYVNVRSLGTDTLGGSDDTGTCMIAHDIAEDGRPIPTEKAPSVMTHGGIVVNTAHESEGKIYIYVIPYNMGSQGLYVFTDELGEDGKWALKGNYTFMNLNSSVVEWGSQGIRVGPSGQVIFYLDHGYVQSFEAASRLNMTVTTIDGNHATVRTAKGGSAAAVLGTLYPGSTIDGSQITIGSKTYDIYGLNEVMWRYDLLTDPYKGRYVGMETFGITDAVYSQIAIVEVNTDPRFSTPGEKGWYFFGGDGPEKCNVRSRASLGKAAGCTMVYSDTKPDFGGVSIMPYMTVARGSSADIALPEEFETTFSVDDPTIIGVAREGNTLVVTGLREDTATISLDIGGFAFDVAVDVLPKVTHVGDDTITESITSKPAPGGGRADTTVVTTSNSEGSVSETTVKTYDSSGNLVGERTLEETKKNSEISQFLDGQLAETEEREEMVKDSSGALVSHTKYRKELISKGSQDATLTTDVIEADLDVLTGALTVSRTEETSTYRFTSTKITVTVKKNDATVSETTEQTVVSANKDTSAAMVGGEAVVTVSTGEPADIGGMVAALEGSGGKPVRVVASGILSSEILDAAADLGADLTMDTGTARILLGAASLAKLKGKGDASFSVVDADASGMTQVQRDAAGGAKVFSISLECGGSHQSAFGAFTVEITCELELREGETLMVWRIDEYGKVTYAEDVSYADGKLSFSADHLSYYAVGYRSEATVEGGGNTLLIGVGVGLAILIGIVAVMALRRK
ncbi:MAG: hypothetical protein GX224_00195 [Thermoplasmatales archaeon]|nr:hypothetical protein [Thermoplasmatales archaeon]